MNRGRFSDSFVGCIAILLLSTTYSSGSEPKTKVTFDVPECIECNDITPAEDSGRRVIEIRMKISSIRIEGDKDAVKQVDVTFQSNRKSLSGKNFKVVNIIPSRKGIIEHEGNI